jgi:hypothetical protein
MRKERSGGPRLFFSLPLCTARLPGFRVSDPRLEIVLVRWQRRKIPAGRRIKRLIQRGDVRDGCQHRALERRALAVADRLHLRVRLDLRA